MGSCFSENIGQKFDYHKLQSAVNPFGILFQPLAIENLITRAINKSYYEKSELININEHWVCLDAHSRLNESTEDLLLQSLNQQIDKTNQYLKDSTHVIITLGTSWIYRYIETDKTVANCHKIPQKKFLKELLKVEEIEESLRATNSLIKSVNKDVAILFTVSPVRHTKEGIIENNRSKSQLISAIHNVVDPRLNLYYFPAYEIMMDELRDYRYYKEDMIHPSNLAVDYIWEKFKLVWFSDKSLELIEKIVKIQSKLSHRPFNPESSEHKKFLAHLELDINSIRKKYPHISF
ncbi:GSCFA domain-containing protein [Winogradskyella sp. A2]|uniref:GSCFA domain-containing protein n=1 Tax=Winogradskyella sp. A2 TaxID=3366944 RepID=UPI00398C375A